MHLLSLLVITETDIILIISEKTKGKNPTWNAAFTPMNWPNQIVPIVNIINEKTKPLKIFDKKLEFILLSLHAIKVAGKNANIYPPFTPRIVPIP